MARMGLHEYEVQLAEANRDLQRAQDDLRDAKERIERENRRVRALNQIVKGLRELEPFDTPQEEQLPIGRVLTVEEVDSLPAPRGREAVRLVMRGSGRDWRPAQVISEVRDRGWIEPDAKAPNAAIRIALRRLVEDQEVERLENGLYRYRDSGVTTPDNAAPEAREPEAATNEEVV